MCSDGDDDERPQQRPGPYEHKRQRNTNINIEYENVDQLIQDDRLIQTLDLQTYGSAFRPRLRRTLARVRGESNGFDEAEVPHALP